MTPLFAHHIAWLIVRAVLLFDMVCVVLRYPLRPVLMRNRGCTTSQIFNWDGIIQ